MGATSIFLILCEEMRDRIWQILPSLIFGLCKGSIKNMRGDKNE